MYFLDRFDSDNLFSLNFDGLNVNSSYFALDMALEAKSFIKLSPDSNPVNAPTPPGPIFADIDGTSGDDNPLNGTNDADNINGLGGDDVINGLDGNDVIDGGGGALAGTAATTGTDTINAGAGDDTIVYSRTTTGSDVDDNDGGTGNDTFLVTSLQAGSTWAVDLTAGEFTFGTFGGTVRGTLTNIENVTYTGEGDFDIRGDSGDNILTVSGDTVNIIEGMGGNDTINAGGGIDTINGGAGNDTIIDGDAWPAGGGNEDVIDGGAGIDTYDIATPSGSPTNNVTVNLATGFVVASGANRDSLTSIENVIVDGDANIIGDAGDNVLTAIGSGENSIFGGAGNDTINAGAGNDFLGGGDGDDIINGEDGNDQIFGDDGADTMDGGAGIDALDYFASDAAVNVNLGAGTASGGYADGDIFSNFENLTGSNGFGDTLTGDGNANRIVGNGGDDTLNGDGGDDTLIGGDGNDVLIGGGGADILNGNAGDDTFNMNIGFDSSNVDTIDGGAGSDTFDINNFSNLYSVNLSTGEWRRVSDNLLLANITNVENIIDGSSGNTLTGNALDNVINGNGGDDIIDGGGGTNTVDGGEGNDTITSSGLGTYLGGAGNDYIFAGLGTPETLDGGTGVDTLDVTSFNSAYTVNLTTGSTNFGGESFTNFENIIMGNGTNNVTGTSGDNEMTGGTGADTFAGLGGADTMDGGAGSDTLDYSASGAAVTVDLNLNTASGGDADGDIISNFESLEGSAFDDVLTSSLFFGTINGNGGNDIINLAGGLDGSNLNGGDGNDIITSAVSMNGSSLVGGAGDDELYLYTDGGLVGAADVGDGGAGDDLIGFRGEIFDQDADGGSGIDTLTLAALAGGYTIDMTLGSVDDGDGLNNATFQDIENIIGSSGADIIIGDAGDNELMGGAGDDVINGGDGDDIIDGGEGGDSINGGAGDDTLIWVNPEASLSDSVDGGTGNDTMVTIGYALGDFSGGTFNLGAGLFEVLGSSLALTNIENYDGSGNSDSAENVIGTSGVNIITMGAGDNRVEGGAGADIMDGGAGSDTLSYAGSGSAVTVNFGTGIASGGDAAGDIFVNFENIYGSQSNDILTGDALANTLEGDLGNDRLDGGDGDDTLIGGEGADTFLGSAGADVNEGGNGFDSADYRGASSAVRFNVDTGGTLGDAAGDTYSGIERYYLSDFNDIVTGSDANEFFYGEDGNDTINGGGGIDRIFGGAGDDIQRGQEGNDLLFGSAGNDQLNGGAGFDVASYDNATSRVVLNLASTGTLGDAAGDTYFGIEAVYGSDFDDVLIGNNSVNELRGGDGDDILNGSGGNDRLFGGEGADSFNGGTGFDIVNYTLSAVAVGVDLINGGFDFSGTGVPSESVGDSYTSIEWVFGSAHSDLILGDDGNNRLEGRGGSDQLNGLGGNDRILGGDGNDSIFGGDGVDTIFGQDGNDNLNGGGGNDFFFGSAGGDSMDGGADFDTVSYLASTSGLIVDLTNSANNTGDAAGDTYVNIERVFGTSFDDSITGSVGDDVLLGHGGSDYLTGGAGSDILLGGANIDSFGYDTTSDGSDFINDFFGGETIYILGGDTNFDTFAELQAVASDAGGNVIFDFGGGNTLTVIGRNIADLDAGDFDFSGTPPASQPLKDMDAFASEPLSFDEIVDLHQAYLSAETASDVDPLI